MEVHAIQCPECQDIIYSRAQHDLRTCTCKEISIDGGFEYLKYEFKCDYDDILHHTLNVSSTEKALYEDWKLGKDKFGVIKP